MGSTPNLGPVQHMATPWVLTHLEGTETPKPGRLTRWKGLEVRAAELGSISGPRALRTPYLGQVSKGVVSICKVSSALSLKASCLYTEKIFDRWLTTTSETTLLFVHWLGMFALVPTVMYLTGLKIDCDGSGVLLSSCCPPLRTTDLLGLKADWFLC